MRPDEIERVRGLVGASFVLGAALVLFYGSANAIFLTRFDVEMLPWVYIVNAVVVIVVGLGYGAWSARVSAARALVALATAMAASVLGLWIWARASDDAIVAFLLATWFRMLFIFAVLGLWEVASAVFDIRQAKRLFAAVALGMMLAFVVGGAATPILSSWLGTVNLVGLAGVGFALYTVAFRRLLRRHQVGTIGTTDSVAPAGPREIVADRYSRRMVWMKSVTILLLYVTEFVFYEQAAGTFRTEESLAGFLGLFFGAMTMVMVLVTGLVSGRFISRFGIRAATLALPVGMLATAAIAGAYGTTIGTDTLFFTLVCVVLATDHVIGNAIGEPAGAVLFQPMPQARRMRVRLAVDGWLGSLALFGSGLLLLAFNAADLDSTAPYLFVVAGIALAGVVVGVLLYRDYVGALRGATTLAFTGNAEVPPLGAPGATIAAASVRAEAADRRRPEIEVQYLEPGSPSTARRAGYRALEELGTTAPIRRHLEADLALLGTIVAAYGDLAVADPLVGDALREEFDLVRRAIYAALAVEYDGRRLRDLETLVRIGGDDDRANAIEALDVMLAGDHRRTIIAALEPPGPQEAASGFARLVPRQLADERLRELAADPRLTPWTRRVAAHQLDHSTRPDGGMTVDPTIARVRSLAGVDIFSTLSHDTLAELAELVEARTAAPGAVVVEAGAVGRELYALVEGTVEVRTTDGRVSRLEPGTVFGELAILDPAPRSATVTAVTPIELLMLSRETLLALTERRPTVMAEIARVLARRLRAAG